MSVPNKALATANPYQKLPGSMWNTRLTDSVTPEMTTVSKPNSKPARLAVTMTPRFLFTSYPPVPRIYKEMREKLNLLCL